MHSYFNKFFGYVGSDTDDGIRGVPSIILEALTMCLGFLILLSWVLNVAAHEKQTTQYAVEQSALVKAEYKLTV